MRKLLLALLLASCCFGKTEVGEINGAPFRVDIPENWNGTLLVYCHGYSVLPVRFSERSANPLLATLTKAGYAVAQSAYAATGWAIAEAALDTESLRRYVIGKYGKPKKTIVLGHSMGGFLTTMLVETQPAGYDGGLPLCGPLEPAPSVLIRALHRRALFDFYFPGVLPDPSHVPADFRPGPELDAKVQKLLDENPQASSILRRYVATKTNKELAGILDFLTYVLKDIQQRAGGNPFDNRNTLYVVTGDDNALNEGVKRYTADPAAYEYVKAYYTLTGKLTKPVLAVHTAYDPLVSPNEPDAYAEMVYQAGNPNLFAQKFVEHDGHCTITPAEILKALNELEAWMPAEPVPPWDCSARND